MKKVFIGVGHGGTDSGATGNGFTEKSLNLNIALHSRNFLENYGVTVIMSRTCDENDSLEEEIRECNAFSPDIAVDIHNNASLTHTADGFETFYHFGGGLSKELAENIEKEVIKLGQNSRGCKTKIGDGGIDYYGFIRETVCPACIVECSFIDNSNDILILDTIQEQKAMGEAIAKGILKTLKIKYIEEDTEMARFRDVPDTHWAYKAIEELAERGILNGYEDGTFKPEQPMTRAEVATIISKVVEAK